LTGHAVELRFPALEHLDRARREPRRIQAVGVDDDAGIGKRVAFGSMVTLVT